MTREDPPPRSRRTVPGGDPLSTNPNGSPPPAPRPFKRSITSIRNVVASYAGTAGEALVFLLLTPFLVRRLGLATYGLWALATALAEWLQLLDFGLREAVTKYAAAHQARAEARAVRRIADTALFCFVLAGVLALGVGGALVTWGLPSLVPNPADLAEVSGALILLCLSGALALPANVTAGILEGLSRFDLLNIFRIGHAMLRLVLIVVALQIGAGLFGIALAELIGRIVLHTWRWYAVYRLDPSLVPRPRLHRGELNRLVQFGVWNAVQRATDILLARIYEPIIAFFAGLSSVGAFHAGRRLATIPAEAVVPMAGVLFPLSSELEAGGRRTALRQTLLRATKVSAMLALPLGMVLGLGARPIQANWLADRAPEMEGVLAIFAVYFLIEAVGQPACAILFGTGSVRLLALTGVAEFLITVSLGIPLTSRLGAIGMGYAAIIGMALPLIALRLPVAAARCELTVISLFARSILPPLLAALPAAVGMYYLQGIVAVGGLAALLSWSAGGLAVYGILLWMFGFDDDDRQFLRSHFYRLILHPSKITDWEEP